MSRTALFKHKTAIFLILFLALGFILRLLFFQTMHFGYDQSRDAIQALSMIKEHHLKIIGPPTDIPGLFHGPLYLYLIAPFYYFSSGNPLVPRFLMILLNLFNVVFIYFFAKRFFKNPTTAWVATFLFAVSFEATQYARWLSNPAPALLFIGIFFYGLWLVFERDEVGLPLMFLAWSIAVEFQFFLVYLGLFLLVALLFVFIKNRKSLLGSIKKYHFLYGGGLVFFSPFIISELKFKFQGSRALLSFFLSHGTRSSLMSNVLNFYHRLIDNIGNSLTYQNNDVAQILFVVFLEIIIYWIIYRRKELGKVLFLCVWLVSPVIAYLIQKNNAYFWNIGNLYPLVLLSSFFIVYVSENLKKVRFPVLIITVVVIGIFNILLIFKNDPYGEVLFNVQENQNLPDEKRVIDYTYQDSGERTYTINVVTNPLFINTTWAYLYDWYGKKKYGYMPVWLGYPPDATSGGIRFADLEGPKRGNVFYLIIEPPGMPEAYIRAYQNYEDLRSRKIDSKKFGSFTVEKRILINEGGFSRDELNLFL